MEGAGVSHVLPRQVGWFLTVYIVDLQGSTRQPIYEAIRDFSPEGAKPALTIVAGSALALPGLKVEVEATAVIDPAADESHRTNSPQSR
jgi:hypothetical protein